MLHVMTSDFDCPGHAYLRQGCHKVRRIDARLEEDLWAQKPFIPNITTKLGTSLWISSSVLLDVFFWLCIMLGKLLRHQDEEVS